jgi:C4-dicarboxylate transporter, DctQ subunit
VKSAKFTGVSKLLDKIIGLTTWFAYISLVLMAAALVVDVCLRTFLAQILPGTIETIQFLMIFVVFFSLAYTSLRGGHVNVDLITSRLPPCFQQIIDSVGYFFGFVIYALISWQLSLRGWENTFAVNPMRTQRLLIPYSPFLFLSALGSLLLCLHLLLNFVSSLFGSRCK